MGLCAVIAAFSLGSVDYNYLNNVGNLPGLKDIWWLAGLVPLVCGATVTFGCGGAVLWKRIVAAAACGAVLGLLYTAMSAILGHAGLFTIGEIITVCAWRIFVFAVLATIGAILTELKLPGPDLE